MQPTPAASAASFLCTSPGSSGAMGAWSWCSWWWLMQPLVVCDEVGEVSVESVVVDIRWRGVSAGRWWPWRGRWVGKRAWIWVGVWALHSQVLL